MTTAVSASGLGKRYGAVWALRDCDLELPAGRVIALVGPNGAGKTTLLQLASGLMRPTTGSVALFDELAPAESSRALAQLGYVAQDHPLYPRFRVRDLLHLGRALNGRWDQRVAERRLADLGIPLDRLAGRLSGGQQAQVALALALAKRPRLLILDEPVASLDPLARREFMQTLMATVVQEDLTVLLSSHNVAELERVCDHLVLITAGRVQLAGDIDALLDSHKLLIGPRAEVPDGPEVVHVERADRHAHVVARIGAAHPMPGWEPRTLSLEDLVLAYLRRSQTRTRPAHDAAVAAHS
ncbi:ABC transporter ATP-binding protein [Intrasporangium sp.]|uniref:ABC transporter ATP-binding protein n=1 Tax=Intrasporangium sp. TaxID=1925024 RepID=UPI00293B6842|nr:ABC transporter ATP-binding protein [Intrasporangium sp.]MDV3220642.1 ABC transporter ATP-binding protein [Intrasporangium sp.]